MKIADLPENSHARNFGADVFGLPAISYRQLEVFLSVCREGSFANAALDLRSTRASIKRICDEFERAVGHPLFEEGEDRRLRQTHFAKGLVEGVKPLSRSLRRMDECVKTIHDAGRVLRFGAAADLFGGGLFAGFLTRLRTDDQYNHCFLRIERSRFQNALLNAECDVYVGVGIIASDRLDVVHLQPVPWRVAFADGIGREAPAAPEVLPAGNWWLASVGDAEMDAAILSEFHSAGAKRGRTWVPQTSVKPSGGDVVFCPDPGPSSGCLDSVWPCLRFSAAIKKHHPYSDLPGRLCEASV